MKETTRAAATSTAGLRSNQFAAREPALPPAVLSRTQSVVHDDNEQTARALYALHESLQDGGCLPPEKHLSREMIFTACSPAVAAALEQAEFSLDDARDLVRQRGPEVRETLRVLPQIQEQPALSLPRCTAQALGTFTKADLLQDELVCRAREAAHAGFAGRCRKLPKGTALSAPPYTVHLEEVAGMLAAYGYSPEVVAAAYLHDHIEDLPGWTKEKIAAGFGSEVAALVDWVTQQDKSLPWEDRNRIYAEHLAASPAEARALSLADKTSNLESLIYFLERGYPVESLLKRGWPDNSKKFHELIGLYQGYVPPAMLQSFCERLAYFDLLGSRSGA